MKELKKMGNSLNMKYQFVVQTPDELWGDIYEIANLEDKLDEHLVNAQVDGHDIGCGEVNIFLDTNDPHGTLIDVKHLLVMEGMDLAVVKIAYREFGAEEYIPLWPEGLEEFKVI